MNELAGCATEEQKEALIRFVNGVFREDFSALLPKLYGENAKTMPFHHIVTENAEIKSVLGSFPVILQVNGKQLCLRGIGTVSTGAADRGKGYMQTLLRQAEEEAREQQAALLFLGGQRHRYERYGYCKATTYLRYRLTVTNRRNAPGAAAPGLSVVRLTEKDAFLEDCVRLHEKQLVHAERPPEQFLDIVRSWDSECWLILQDGEFLGYAVAKKREKDVHELLMTDYRHALAAAFLLVEQYGEELMFYPAFYQQTLMQALAPAAESAVVGYEEMIHVLDYPAVIEAFLGLKQHLFGIADGSLVFEDRQEGRFEIVVHDGAVSVYPTEKEPAVSLPHVEMMAWLFRPTGAYVHPYRSPAEKSWLPIPINFYETDFV